MTFYFEARKYRFGWIIRIFLFCLVVVSSHENIPSNHQSTPDASTLKIEARESEASITLGKDLILGPPLSTKESIVVNSSNFNDIATTKTDSLVSPVIVSRTSSGEHGASVIRRPILKDTSSRWSSQAADNRHWASKGSKTAWKRDSYLEALKHSRTSDDPREGIVRTDSKTKVNRREYVPGPVYKSETEYGAPDSAYPMKSPRIVYGGPGASSSTSDSYAQSFKSPMDFSDHYSAPQSSYGAPQNPYGPPQNPYGPPQNPYGPPQNPHSSPQNPYGPSSSSLYSQTSYGPPGGSYLMPQQGYGTSVHSSPPSFYGSPYALPDFSQFSILPTFDLGWPLALKLNAFTIAKIILKLVIFKMIVKFIAAICLLLFIPKLEIIKKKTNKGEDDEERSLSSPYTSSETLNDLETVVRNSVEKYEAQNGAPSSSTEKCTTLVCRVTEALTFRESWNDYLNLFKSYAEEERRRNTTKREEH